VNGKTNEKIIYQCSEFVMVRDITWTNENLKEMHYLIIFTDPNLYSIRDLNQKHVKLLLDIVQIGKQKISELHNINLIDLEIYFHYHPSIWQLHMHFASNTIVDIYHKKFIVNHVIDNLINDNNYYKKDITL